MRDELMNVEDCCTCGSGCDTGHDADCCDGENLAEYLPDSLWTGNGVFKRKIRVFCFKCAESLVDQKLFEPCV